ncbi:MAG: mechanosensitive ion channel domain-containing protein [Catalinimonas sp.]
MYDLLNPYVGDLPNYLQALIYLAVTVAGSFAVGLLLRFVVFRGVRYWEKQNNFVLFESVLKHLRAPLGWFIPLLILFVVLPSTPLDDLIGDLGYYRLFKFEEVLMLIALGWTLLEVLNVAQDVVYDQYTLQSDNNLSARKVRTQMQYIRKLAGVAVVVVVVGLILMSFERVRQFGAGLLTSAGVAGIIVGFAAQRSIANLLAGFQIAFTQPIRIDDVVIAEGEWGRIEEITLTYVVVRIWDKRRLILPITYFIEKPFQNWTRVSADILGTIFLYVDYTIPIEALRKELDRLLDDSKLWDGEVGIIQVTNTTERTVELRLLVSARTSSDAWDLRCFLRENMIGFVQREYPESLPRTRAELSQDQPPRRRQGEHAQAEHVSPGAEEEHKRDGDR